MKIVSIFFLIINILLTTSCIPVKDRHEEKRFSKDFEGFTDENTFQVVCKEVYSGNDNGLDFRPVLLKNCKEHLISTLAKFRVAYEYNSDIAKSRNPAQRSSTLAKGRPGAILKNDKKIDDSADDSVNAFEYDIINKQVLITDISQIELLWTSAQIEDLKIIYGPLLPGQIIREWTDGEAIYIVYRIRKENLMQFIKNSKLPFGFEFSR